MRTKIMRGLGVVFGQCTTQLGIITANIGVEL